ncbi:hypothetical protein P0Y67_22645 [Photobacterium sp. SP02]|uniref:hypothetical protein n=1 Tax=Photobacterium sp. SP02 TaxID=3032280 RepID=UPI003144EEB6
MTIDHKLFIGKKYNELLAIPDFLSLIGGNVPEVVDEGSENFYIVVDSKKIELIFSRETQVLKVIVFHTNSQGLFPEGLSTSMTNNDVYRLLGKPIETVPERKIPVLGLVPSCDKFPNGLQVFYSLGEKKVQEVRYALSI